MSIAIFSFICWSHAYFCLKEGGVQRFVVLIRHFTEYVSNEPLSHITISSLLSKTITSHLPRDVYKQGLGSCNELSVLLIPFLVLVHFHFFFNNDPSLKPCSRFLNKNQHDKNTSNTTTPVHTSRIPVTRQEQYHDCSRNTLPNSIILWKIDSNNDTSSASSQNNVIVKADIKSNIISSHRRNIIDNVNFDTSKLSQPRTTCQT